VNGARPSATRAARCFVAIVACGFAIGGANHALDIARGGFLPYGAVPMPVNAFWTALCPLDLAVVALAWVRPRSAVALGLAILLADVATNSWLAYFSGLHPRSLEPLQVQSTFLGFVLGGAPFVLGRERRPAP
jgi:hypothetical protein